MVAARLETVRIAPDAIHVALREVLRRIALAAPDACLVGGAVRDLLRGVTPYDLDVTVSGDAAAAAAAIAAATGGTWFAMAEERGHFRVVLPAGGPARDIDVSSRGAGLEADLLRRDFSVNALAAPVQADGSLGEIVDVCDGLTDIERRRLRAVSEANLADDPLRLLRAVRLAAETGFDIEPATLAMIERLAPSLVRAAPERQRDELVRILATNGAAAALDLLDRCGLLTALIPELMPAKGVEQPRQHHFYDVFDHSLVTLQALDSLLSPAGDAASDAWLGASLRRALDWYPLDGYLQGQTGAATRRVLLKLAGLLHDVAKPQTRSIEPDGRVRFFGHSELGAEVAERIMRRLRFGAREGRFVALLVEEHLRPGQLSQAGAPSRRAIYRFFRDLDEAAPACLLLFLADGAAAAGPRMTRQQWQVQLDYVVWVLQQAQVLQEVQDRQPRLLTGDDLIEELGLQPGPQLGRLLQAIGEAHGAGEIETKEQALTLARTLAEEASRGDDTGGEGYERR